MRHATLLSPGYEYLYERTLEYRRLESLTGLSKRVRQRLKRFDRYHARGENAGLTCRHFGSSPQTFYRWKRRYSGSHPGSPEGRWCCPLHVRQPCCSVELVETACELREECLLRGRDKLAALPHDKDHRCLAPTVGRRPQRLRALGV